MEPIARGQQVVAEWRRHFGPVAPVAFKCRVTHRERWFRIHSLAGSKRYPESAAERSEVVRRQLEVAASSLGAGEELSLFVALFGEFRPPPPRVPGVPPLVPLDTLTEVDPDETIWFWSAPLRFDPGQLTDTILACADDLLGPTLFANLSRGTAFAPYDGGADVFLASPDEVTDARRRWASWLSGHPSGL